MADEKIPFDYLGAKKAGYSDKEIQDHLKTTYSFDFDITGAKGSGYSDNEIADYITKYEAPSKKKVGGTSSEESFPTSLSEVLFANSQGQSQKDGHSASWNKTQADMAKRASEAGLPNFSNGNERLSDAIKRSEKAGYKFDHFTDNNDPTGDRTVTIDIENLTKALKRRLSNAKNATEKTSVSKELKYWEEELKDGMTAAEWEKQTGEKDPQLPSKESFPTSFTDVLSTSLQGRKPKDEKNEFVNETPLPINYSPSIKQAVDRENYAKQYEERQSAASEVEKYPQTLQYDMNIEAAEKESGDIITLKREQTSLPHIAGISLGGNVNVDRNKYIEEQKALRDQVVVKNNELKREAALALQKVRGNVNRNVEHITNNLDNFTTTSGEGDKIPDVNKINDYAKDQAIKHGLSDEGYYKNLLYNEAKANVNHKIIEPKVIERLNENYKTKFGKSIDEETTAEALNGFTRDEEIVAKAKVQVKSIQDTISAEAKQEVDALNTAVTQEADAIKEQYKQAAPLAQNEQQANDLYTQTGAAIDKLNQDFLRQQNEINSKYNARYRRQTDEIARIANQKIKEEGEKYQYKRSPDFQKRIEAEYKEAYKQVLDENNARLEERDKTFNPMVNFGRTFLTSLGGAIKGISSSVDFDTGKVFGDYLSTLYQHGTTEIKEFKDLLDLNKMAKSAGSLGGGMTPALIAAAGTTLATEGAGAPAALSMLASGFTSWGAETMQMAGQMYEDKFAETGDVASSEKAAKQTFDSQVLLMPLYALDGLPFMGKSIKLAKNLPTRMLLGGTIEMGTEFLQEYPQNLFEEAIKNDQNYMEGLNLSSMERAKNTFLNIAPTFFMGAAGQGVGAISQAREDSLARTAGRTFAAKNGIKGIPVNYQDQYVLDILQRKGKPFATAYVGALFSNGSISEEQSTKLTETIKTSEETLANAKKYGLDPAQQKVYGSFALKKAEALAAAEAQTDPILKIAAMQDVRAIEDDMVKFVTGEKADYSVVTLPNNEQYVMTKTEADTAAEDLEFQDAYERGNIKVETYGTRGALQETLDQIDAEKKKPVEEIDPEKVIMDAANDGHFGFTGEMVKSGQVSPKQALLELAAQKYGVLGDGSVDPKGGRDISMKSSIAVDEAVTKVYPDQQSVVNEMTKQAAAQPKAEGVVPSLGNVESIEKALIDLGEDVFFDKIYNFSNYEYGSDISGVAEEYYAAKKDGSNPKLVKAVEDAIASNPSLQAKNKVEKSDSIFGDKLESKAHNYDNPLAEMNKDGANYRIAEGLIENKKKTYLLYKDGEVVGKFNSVDDAKKAVTKTAQPKAEGVVPSFKVGDDIQTQQGVAKVTGFTEGGGIKYAFADGRKGMVVPTKAQDRKESPATEVSTEQENVSDIESALDQYSESGDPYELVANIEGIDNPKLQEAVKYWQDELEYDRSISGRHDMEMVEQNLVKKVKEAKQQTSPIQGEKLTKESTKLPENWKQIKDIEVDVPSLDPKTGKATKERMTAKEAYVKLSKQIKQLDNVLNCI